MPKNCEDKAKTNCTKHRECCPEHQALVCASAPRGDLSQWFWNSWARALGLTSTSASWARARFLRGEGHRPPHALLDQRPHPGQTVTHRRGRCVCRRNSVCVTHAQSRVLRGRESRQPTGTAQPGPRARHLPPAPNTRDRLPGEGGYSRPLLEYRGQNTLQTQEARNCSQKARAAGRTPESQAGPMWAKWL